MGEWLAGDEKFFLQQFKDSGDLIGEKIEPYDEEEMKTLLDLIRRFVPNAQLRGV
jgi:pyruvate formate lyase activating enzyme